jgi:hypothetical protein
VEKIDAGQRRWLLALSAVLIALTVLPYVVGFASAGSEWEFSGFLVGVEDGNSYLAKMLRGTEGDWLFRTPYTHLPQTGVAVFLPYLFLGKLAGGEATHLQLVSLFHLLRLAAIPLVAFAAYRFIAYFITPPDMRRWATLLAIAGGGLGWLSPMLGWYIGWKSTPLAFLSPETFGFLGLLTLPHHALARALMLLAIVKYLESLGSESTMLRAGFLSLGTFIVNPLTGVSLFLVLGLHQIAVAARDGVPGLAKVGVARMRQMLTLVLPAMPYILYLGYSRSTDPFLDSWAQQNQVISPPPGMYLLAYALVAFPVLLGILRVVRRADRSELLPIVWIVALPLLIYAPVGIQRRLPEGSWLALSVATVWGLQAMRERVRRFVLPLLLAGSLTGSALLLLGTFLSALRPAQPSFVLVQYTGVYRFLAENARDGDVVLASFETSNALPAWAPVRVPIGHGPESVRLEEMEGQVTRFFSDEGARERVAATFDASWAIWGPREESLAGASTVPRVWSIVAEWGEVKLLAIATNP